MSPAVLTPPGPRQMTAATDELLGHRDFRLIERARWRRLDAGLQCRLSVLSPPLATSGCSVAGVLTGAPGTTARDRMRMREMAGIFFQDQDRLEAGYFIRMVLALVIDGPVWCLHG